MFESLLAVQIAAVAASAMFLGYFSTSELVIDDFSVPASYAANGYDSDTITEIFWDELLHLNGEAVLSKPIDIDKSLSMVKHVFQTFKEGGPTGGIFQLMEGIPTPAETKKPKSEPFDGERLNALDLYLTEDIKINDVNENTAHIGIKEIEDQLGLSPFVNGIGMMLGYSRATIGAELTSVGEKKVSLKVRLERVISSGKRKVDFGAERKVDYFTVVGDKSEVVDVVKTAAFLSMKVMNPYVTLIHTLRVEKKYGNDEYPGTKKAINDFIANTDLEDHYLAYSLHGRVLLIQHEANEYSGEKSAEILLEAKDNIQHSLNLNPDYILSTLTLGVINAWEGNNSEANKLFHKAVVIDPNYLPSRVTWAEFLETIRDYNGAIVQAEAALFLDPYSVMALNNLARLYQKNNQLDDYDDTMKKINLLTPRFLN